MVVLIGILFCILSVHAEDIKINQTSNKIKPKAVLPILSWKSATECKNDCNFFEYNNDMMLFGFQDPNLTDDLKLGLSQAISKALDK